MKKRILALAGALVLTFAMSMNVFAAGSVTTEDAANDAKEDLAPTQEVQELKIGSQQLTVEKIESFVSATTVKSDVQAALSKVTTDTAKEAVAKAKAVVGESATIATVVDLVVPEGTGKASFTLGVSNVMAGQSVTILHKLADGSWETISPDKVENGAVTFTLSSYSPVAVVINAAAPKTGEAVPAAAVLAVVCLAGAVLYTRKAKVN